MLCIDSFPQYWSRKQSKIFISFPLERKQVESTSSTLSSSSTLILALPFICIKHGTEMNGVRDHAKSPQRPSAHQSTDLTPHFLFSSTSKTRTFVSKKLLTHSYNFFFRWNTVCMPLKNYFRVTLYRWMNLFFSLFHADKNGQAH